MVFSYVKLLNVFCLQDMYCMESLICWCRDVCNIWRELTHSSNKKGGETGKEILTFTFNIYTFVQNNLQCIQYISYTENYGAYNMTKLFELCKFELLTSVI